MNIRSKIFGGKTEESPVLQGKSPKGARADTLHSISVARETTRKANTRDGDRHRLPDEQVRVTHDGQSYEVQLINLSGGGAMIAGDFEPKLWDRLELHLGPNGTVDCAVRWLRDGRVGLEFAHETRLDCSADERATVLREVIARSFPDIEFEAPIEASASTVEGEQRGGRRHPLIWSGVIHHDYQSTPVRLRNISETGAMIECHAPLRVGAELLLELGEGVQAFTKVAWVVGDSAGLAFDKPFDLAQLSRSRPDVAADRWERPNYLEPGVRAEDTPWDERMTLGELRQSLEGFLKR
jgi:hypothetical protein